MTALRPRLSGLSGAERSARLLEALGPAGEPVWARLSDAESRAIAAAMDGPQRSAAPAQDDAPAMIGFADLAGCDVARMADALSGERPAVAALILSQLDPALGAAIVCAMKRPEAGRVMARLLQPVTPVPGVLDALNAGLIRHVGGTGSASPASGLDTVAGVLECLPADEAERLIARLGQQAPAEAEALRRRIVRFEDLAHLDPAGMQTLLAQTERGDLVLALKAAPQAVRRAVLANMTRRAGEALGEELAALGPVRREQVMAARERLVATVRRLIVAGDIRPPGARAKPDELIE